jgi:hypothetical protein
VTRLFFDQSKGRAVREVSPRDVSSLEVRADRLHGTCELALFDSESLQMEADGGALLHEHEGFEQSGGILAAGDADSDAIAFADHVEIADGLPHFAQESSFQVHGLDYRW